MAVAVLKGDLIAAHALADLLMDEYSEGAKEILPVRRISMDVSHVRAIVYVRNFPPAVPTLEIDGAGIKRAVREWLQGPTCPEGDPGPLVLINVDRVELFELPPIPPRDEVENIPKQAITLAARELLKRGR
jgi:hypothetical protein